MDAHTQDPSPVSKLPPRSPDRAQQKGPGASSTTGNRPPYHPLPERERSESYRSDCHDRRTVILRLLGVIWKETIENFFRLPQPTLPQNSQKQLLPFPTSPPRSRVSDDPPGRYSSGPPSPSSDWYPSSQSPYPRRWTPAEEDAYWEATAALPRWEDQPPPGRVESLIVMHHHHLQEAMVGWDFARGWCLCHYHFLRYCIMLM